MTFLQSLQRRRHLIKGDPNCSLSEEPGVVISCRERERGREKNSLMLPSLCPSFNYLAPDSMHRCSEAAWRRRRRRAVPAVCDWNLGKHHSWLGFVSGVCTSQILRQKRKGGGGDQGYNQSLALLLVFVFWKNFSGNGLGVWISRFCTNQIIQL